MPTIDLSQLPPPDVIETPDFEDLRAEYKQTLLNALPAALREDVAQVLSLESEPLTKLLEVFTYHSLLLRQRINEACLANMVAYARGSDLDQLGANVSTPRLVIREADDTAVPPAPAVYESDTDYRLRLPQAFEGLSTAGPQGAYIAHARQADGRVADASAISPSPACVTVSVLSREGDGTASADLLRKIEAALNDEDVRPVADRLTVQSARIVAYTVEAELHLCPLPESEPVRAAAADHLQRYVTAQHRLGRAIRRSAIFAALHAEGVLQVVLTKPEKDIVLNETQAAYCTRITLTVKESRT